MKFGSELDGHSTQLDYGDDSKYLVSFSMAIKDFTVTDAPGAVDEICNRFCAKGTCHKKILLLSLLSLS